MSALGAGKEILFFLFTVGFVFHLFMSLKCDLLFLIHFSVIQAWRGLFFFYSSAHKLFTQCEENVLTL